MDTALTTEHHPKRRKRVSPGYLFVAPAVILITLLAIYPTFRVISLSLFDLNRRTGVNTYVGIENYAKLVADPMFPKVFRQTLQFAFFCSVGHIFIGFFLALLLNTGINRKFLGTCRALILLPWALSPIVVAIIAQLWAYPLISPIAKILTALGSQAEFAPLAKPSTAMWSLILINVWQFTPFYMLMILAGLQSLDPELHDAAKVDGGRAFYRFRRITLPMLAPTILVALLFRCMDALRTFDLIYGLTNGGPGTSTETLSSFTYRYYFSSAQFGLGSAYGMVVFVLILCLSLVYISRLRKNLRFKR